MKRTIANGRNHIVGTKFGCWDGWGGAMVAGRLVIVTKAAAPQPSPNRQNDTLTPGMARHRVKDRAADIG